ncbi:MAG: hypothetical protein HQL56_09465 [Magnetococcales bacterium]|nr:hypothetical protein [Magnetococcales bacterium]
MSYSATKRPQPFPSLPEERQNGLQAQPAIPEWRKQQQREDNQNLWVENRAAEIRRETGWDTTNPAPEVQATFDSQEHARKHGPDIWDLPGGIPQPKWANDAEKTLPDMVGNKPSSRQPAIPKWDFGASNDADDLWESPELQLGLNRLALQDISRQHPDWDLSTLEPMARGGALAGIGSMLKGMTGQTPANGFPNMMMAAAETTQSDGGSGFEDIMRWLKEAGAWLADKGIGKVIDMIQYPPLKYGLKGVKFIADHGEEIGKKLPSGNGENSRKAAIDGCGGQTNQEKCMAEATNKYSTEQEKKEKEARSIQLKNMGIKPPEDSTQQKPEDQKPN